MLTSIEVIVSDEEPSGKVITADGEQAVVELIVLFGDDMGDDAPPVHDASAVDGEIENVNRTTSPG
jgi:hypothetical protein